MGICCYQKKVDKPLMCKKKDITEMKSYSAPQPIMNQFNEMPEYGNNIYKGYGIKRMKACRCTLNISELNNLRDAFWNTMYLEDKVIWPIIYQACVFDHQKAEIYLANNNLSTQKGCINNIVDFKGKVYHIPNYCINEPYFEKEILPKDIKDIHNKQIKITLIDLYCLKKTIMKISENITGEQLKHLYSTMTLKGRNISNSKLIFGGCIIKNNESLYQHKIQSGYTIHIIINPNLT